MRTVHAAGPRTVPVPQLHGLPSLPKDRDGGAGPAGGAARQRLQRQGIAGRVRDSNRQVSLPEIEQAQVNAALGRVPPCTPLAQTFSDSGSNGAVSEQASAASETGAELEQVVTICTCEEFDKVLLSELLTATLSMPCTWTIREEAKYVPLSDGRVDFSPKKARAASLIPFGSPRGAHSFSSKGQASNASWTDKALSEKLLSKLDEEEREDEDEAAFGASQGSKSEHSDCRRCLIFFDYGVVVMWGLAKDEEEDFLRHVVNPAAVRQLPKRFVERDEMTLKYCYDAEPQIRNDVITLQHRLHRDGDTRMAIAHAVAQSTKLSVFEAQGLQLVQSTRHLPRELAEKGTVSLTRSDLSKLIGRLFMQKSEVDMLSSVLDIPEYFWSAPDSLQELYKKVCEYLEMEERIEAVNGRLEVSESMLDMLQNQHDVNHGERLEWIVIWLIVFEVFVGLLEFAGTVGLIPQWPGGED